MQRPRRNLWQKLLILGVLLACGAALVGAWYFEGLVVPIVVDSGSMAESILGPHRNATCPGCGWRFPVGNDPPPRDSGAVCPNCGLAGIDVKELSERPGERMIVDRASLALRAPRRYETVVFHCPDSPAQYCVKRIVGLPGETIEIPHGDIHLDSQPLRKSLAQLELSAIAVYDTRFAPSAAEPTAPPRWRSASPRSRWSVTPHGGFMHDNAEPTVPGAQTSPGEADALVYHHLRPTHDGGVAPGSITDDLGYNQGQSRVLNEVSDVWLRGKLRANGKGWLKLSALSGQRRFELRLDPDSGQGSLSQNGRTSQGFSAGRKLLATPSLVTWGICDERVFLAIDGNLLVEQSFTPSEPFSGGPEPLAISAQDLQINVEYLEVLRDVYYVDAGPATFRLAAAEYFLLGDNSSASADSRTWAEGPGLPAKMLIGLPRMPFHGR